jgi:hypothetical protein
MYLYLGVTLSQRQGRALVWGAVAIFVAVFAVLGGVLVVSAGAAGSPPAFVQQVTAHAGAVTSLAVTPSAAVASGDRLVVETGVWSQGGATMSSVTNSAGDTFVELLHFKASDGTEMSVWTAPITAGAGTKPTITAKPTAKADVGLAVLEYSGLSTVTDATVMDQSAQSSGTTTSAATVSSGATAATSAAGELALGFYADSGFGDTPTAGTGWTSRASIPNTRDIGLLAEDQALPASGATPNATAGTGAKTTWLMATVVLKSGTTTPPTVPGAPTAVTATAGNAGASVSWTAPSNGGAAVTSYTITPYIGTTAQTPTTINGTPPATTTTINNLTNGTAYTFTVTATNSVGTGPPSTASSPVTPVASGPSPVIDQSTPAIVGVANNISAVSSNSFSPPSGSVIYMTFALDSDPNGPADPHVVSVTNSGSPLTWHLKGSANQTGDGVGGYVEVWWAYNATAQSNITVTGNLSEPTKNVTPPIGAVQAIVFTGAAPDQSSAAWGSGDNVTTGSPPTATLTTTAPDSLVLAVANNWDSSVTPTTPSDQTTTLNGQASVVLNPTDLDTYWVQAKTGPTVTPGPVTINDTAPSVRYHMVAWEVLAGSPGPPTAPAAPTGVTAVAGNGSATVSWTAPSDGGSPITSYTVTPYAGTTALHTTTISGTPPATSTTITNLSNGTAYTFTVTATNGIGTGPPSSASNAVTPANQARPAFVQQASAHAGSVASLAVTPSSTVAAGDRLVVETGVWSRGGATIASVTDSAGDTFVELLHFKASDGTEMSVWTAPITAGAGMKPTITATPTSTADVGVAALEYSGLSSVAGATIMDQSAQSSGTTSGAATVSSGATPATTAPNELALGFYADSGFGDTLTAGPGWTSRANVSGTDDMEFLAEEQALPASGATPSATAGTGARTSWLMATVVLK